MLSFAVIRIEEAAAAAALQRATRNFGHLGQANHQAYGFCALPCTPELSFHNMSASRHKGKDLTAMVTPPPSSYS